MNFYKQIALSKTKKPALRLRKLSPHLSASTNNEGGSPATKTLPTTPPLITPDKSNNTGWFDLLCNTLWPSRDKKETSKPTTAPEAGDTPTSPTLGANELEPGTHATGYSQVVGHPNLTILDEDYVGNPEDNLKTNPDTQKQIDGKCFVDAALLLTSPTLRSVKAAVAVGTEQMANEAGLKKFETTVFPESTKDLLDPSEYCSFAKPKKAAKRLRAPQISLILKGKVLSIDSFFNTYDLTYHENVKSESEKQKANYITAFAHTLIHRFKAGTDAEKVSVLFSFVQELKYTLGGFDKKALDTLLSGEGTCSNKANLFIALCRAVGIPACGNIFEVKCPDYFGEVLQIPELTFWTSYKSTHVAALVHTNEKWFAVDPSDNFGLCVSEVGPTLLPVTFQPNNPDPNHASLYLSPDSVLNQRPVKDLDSYLSKDLYSGTKTPVFIAMLRFIIDYAQNHYGTDSKGKMQSVPKDFSKRYEDKIAWLKDPQSDSRYTLEYRLEVIEKYENFMKRNLDVTDQKTFDLVTNYKRISQGQEALNKSRENGEKESPWNLFLQKVREEWGPVFGNPAGVIHGNRYAAAVIPKSKL